MEDLEQSFKYTTEYLNELVCCPKLLDSSFMSELKEDTGHYRKNFSLTSEDGKEKFSAFIRVCSAFNENFSIGLIHHHLNGQSPIILRCNGPHDNKNIEHHSVFHYHKIPEESIKDGTLNEKEAIIINEYTNHEEALKFFLKMINVINGEKYTKQDTLF